MHSQDVKNDGTVNVCKLEVKTKPAVIFSVTA